MAACSEQEIDGKLSTDFCSNFPVSPVPIQNSELFIKKSRTSERILLEKVSNNESPDLSQLSDEQFEDILKELAQCKSAARSSSLVRCLRRGVRDREEAPPSLHGAPHRSLQDLPQCTRVAGRGRPGRPGGPPCEAETPPGDARPALNNGTAHRDDLAAKPTAVELLETKTFLLESEATGSRVGGRPGKGKKGRNHAEETVRLARHIEGNRGDDAIDALVAFICSEDKAGKGPNGLDRKLKAAPRRARHPPRERERPFSPSFYSDQGAEPEEGPGRPDVSSYSDVDQVQEEFRLVTKKQRRRGKEALPRRPPCPAPVTPPSEPSSPSDSGGGTQPSPRPTPPTSYADVARMPRGGCRTPPPALPPPPVVLLGGASLPPCGPLGQITFGFDVNEQLVRMTLDGPRPPDPLGSFNYADVVHFLGSAWNRAFQSNKRDPDGGSGPDCGGAGTACYYRDASAPGRPDS
ncbi:protein PRRC2A-like [Ixodes scapularis]|uniref:protein PRRC2A-like n=1 Tax=Ixodes scapularis TaxID=6945 RepID=UPI001A9D74A3|nr:protein PRRC2A-like [Ixodes scapularis]